MKTKVEKKNILYTMFKACDKTFLFREVDLTSGEVFLSSNRPTKFENL